MLLSLRAVLNDSTIITLFLFQRISSIYYDRIALPNSYYEKFTLSGEVKCIDEEIPFEIPNGWEWCRLENLGEIIATKPFQILQSEIEKIGDTRNKLVPEGTIRIWVSKNKLAVKKQQYPTGD